MSCIWFRHLQKALCNGLVGASHNSSYLIAFFRKSLNWSRKIKTLEEGYQVWRTMCWFTPQMCSTVRPVPDACWELGTPPGSPIQCQKHMLTPRVCISKTLDPGAKLGFKSRQYLMDAVISIGVLGQNPSPKFAFHFIFHTLKSILLCILWSFLSKIY